nr:protein VAPYRIN-like isoform X2 [Procambarus clarkii]
MGSNQSSAQICICQPSGDLPYEVYAAAMNGHLKPVSRYLNQGGKVNAMYKGWTLLHTACYHGRDRVVVELLRHWDICVNLRTCDKNMDTALIMAARMGHLDCIEALFSASTKCPLDKDGKNSYGQTARDDACVHNKQDVIFYLLAVRQT